MSKHQISSNSAIKPFVSDRELIPASFHPKLICKVSVFPARIVFYQGDRHLTLEVSSQSQEALPKLFLVMDGTKSLIELQQQFSSNNPQVIETIVRDLERQGLVEDANRTRINSGIDTVLELERATAKYWAENDEQHLLWQQIGSADSALATKVLSGLAIEYYYFFTQKSCLDAAILSFSGASQVQELVNQMYHQEYQRAEILGQALEAIGIDQADLAQTVPLAQTTAICNGLAYWANFDRLFFLSTLDLVRKQTFDDLSCGLQVGKQLDLQTSFLEQIARLIDGNLGRDENLTRRIFQEIAVIETIEKQRFWGQTHLLVEIYNTFYRAIWSHYSAAPHLLRNVASF